MKQVALYYPWIHLRGGAERVILEIARHSRHRWTIFTSHLDQDGTFPEFKTLPRVVVIDRVPVERSFGRVLRAAVAIAGRRLDLTEFDGLVVVSEGLGDFITFRNHAPVTACLCLTPARPVFDPVYRRAWLERHRSARLPLALLSAVYRALTRVAWRRYDRVFADSRETSRRIEAGRICPMAKVEVLYPGVNAAAVTPRFAHDRYFLYAGRLKWTKNVELAIDAFRVFADRSPPADGWRLVVAGAVDAASRDYVAALRGRAGTDANITFQENPTDVELARLYAGCCALVFPSLNEDWGIVPLEAMAHGKPVLAVNRGGPVESVVHEETGYLLEPVAAAFAGAMRRLAADPALGERLGRAGAARARRFSWEAFVTRLDDYLDGAPLPLNTAS